MNENNKSQDGDPREWSSVTISAPGAATHQGMVYAIQHPITGEYMCEWADYILQPIDDYEKRCELCGKSEGVPVEINALVLGKSIEETRAIATIRYQQGAAIFMTAR